MGAVSGAHARPLPPPALERPLSADLMRVLATGMVGWFHLWQQSWVGAGKLDFLIRSGYAWVDCLVLLSAFCLFLPYANAKAAGKPCPAGGALAFYRRRAVRILPAYYASLLFSLGIALAKNGWSLRLGQDLAAHLTMTQTFFRFSYLYSQLNAVTWTLAVFALFYLVFPLLARAMFRAPLRTVGALLAVQLLWRCFVLRFVGTNEYPMLFNQFPAFASTFALGMAGALAFAWLGRRQAVGRWPVRLGASLLGVGALAAAAGLLRQLAAARQIQVWQLNWRTPLVLCFCAAVVGLGLGLPLPGGRLLRFLAGVSYSFYLWHQMLAVWLKYDLRIPAWSGQTPPNQLGDRVWMNRYNLLCWAVALAAALAGTYLIEKPAARWLARPRRSSGTFAGNVV